MKTNTNPQIKSVFQNVRRFFIAALCVSFISIFATPAASAANPNGKYKFVRAHGTLSIGGEKIDIPQELVQELGALKNGKIVIKKKRLQLNRKAGAKIIKDLGKELGVPVKVDISGPSSVKLKKSKKTHRGGTKKPVIVKFKANYEGQDISGNLKTSFRAKVKGKTLTLTVPISGKILGEKLKGKLIIVGKR
jgi:hypothetical protein